MPEEIRHMASDAARSPDPVRRERHEENLRRGERCYPERRKLWVNGRVSEERDEWTEEVRAHCERCCDDKAETPEAHAERIRRQRISGDRRVALHGRRVAITVDKVLRARGKMLRNKANGPADCLVTEMLQCFPTETVYEVTHWFQGEYRALKARKTLRLLFLKKPDARLLSGIRLFWWIYCTR